MTKLISLSVRHTLDGKELWLEAKFSGDLDTLSVRITEESLNRVTKNIINELDENVRIALEDL